MTLCFFLDILLLLALYQTVQRSEWVLLPSPPPPLLPPSQPHTHSVFLVCCSPSLRPDICNYSQLLITQHVPLLALVVCHWLLNNLPGYYPDCDYYLIWFSSTTVYTEGKDLNDKDGVQENNAKIKPQKFRRDFKSSILG